MTSRMMYRIRYIDDIVVPTEMSIYPNVVNMQDGLDVACQLLNDVGYL